jgi:hypothetical protein
MAKKIIITKSYISDAMLAEIDAAYAEREAQFDQYEQDYLNDTEKRRTRSY